MNWQAITPEPNLLGESPFWQPHEQQLYWVDIAARCICRCNIFMGTVQYWHLPSEPGCIAPVQGGGLVMALRDGVYLADDWQAPLQRIAEFDYPTATTRANDGKCDPMGRFWVGTYYEPRDQPLAALYCLDALTPGYVQISRKLDHAQVANGLAWSPDGRTLYWADTGAHVVRAWDWNARDNALGTSRVLAQFSPKSVGSSYAGRPDGAAVDSAGNYWVAMYEGARVLQLAPDGQVLADIPAPAQCPTMLCFGGDDYKTLFLTTARQKRPPEELQRLPQSGCVFSMRVQTPGLPVNYFNYRP